MNLDKSDVLNLLKAFIPTGFKTNVIELDMIASVTLHNTNVAIVVKWAETDQKVIEMFKDELKQFLEARGLTVISVTVGSGQNTPQSEKSPFDDQKKLSGVKHIIAVASGKGGVGKSTIASNLAAMLAANQYRVGLLDADIYGPSMNVMMGKRDAKPTTPDGKRIDPIESHGIKTISMGYLTEPEMAVIWRGPMLMKAISQFLNDVNWGDLDYLIIDMPPGTGDVQLSITQQVPLSGALIVTTPQDVALMDVQRGVKMFEKVNVPVFGVIENMSYHKCKSCGHVEHIFGQDKVEAMVQKMKTSVIGRFPLDAQIVEAADEGEPIVVRDKDGDISKEYLAIMQHVVSKVS
jgi:ATP-binding protein involved in chromosome partitioning